jgi:hypothetical protein
MNQSKRLNVAGSMSCIVIDGIVASAIEPKRSALKTGEQAVSTTRRAGNYWMPSMSAITSTNMRPPTKRSSSPVACAS